MAVLCRWYMTFCSPLLLCPATLLPCLQFKGGDGLYVCLCVLIWAIILGLFMAHPQLSAELLGHEVNVGTAGILTGGTDVPTMQPLVTVGDSVLMGEQPTPLEACFGAGLRVISFFNLVQPDPSMAVTAMRAAFKLPANPPAPGARPTVRDALIMSLTCLAQHFVRLRNAFAEERKKAMQQLQQKLQRGLAGSS